ncbi:MAG TPA: Xaa-Pro peptidase family protein [Candidatus Acidoferrales bacterium]|nr:Xaa-Pro peptidase family protein [Candidatus Acidoferrales bacterium]
MPDLAAIQAELLKQKLDGWLFYDHHHRDPIAGRILGLSTSDKVTRRWFYYIPARGTPGKLVHRIESRQLDSLPGRKTEYSSWEELHKGVAKLLRGSKQIAMEYSRNNDIPYVGLVDAGTIELIRKCGPKVISSADLVQQFEAAWTPDQFASHQAAGRVIDQVTREAFARAGSFVRERKPLTEYDLQQWMLGQMRAHSVVTDDPPNASAGPNSGNPHYEPKTSGSSPIREGDLLLLDVWGKLDRPGSVYYDITWMGYLGSVVPAKYAKLFQVVRQARDAAIKVVKDSVAAGRVIHGWEVDRAARGVIRKAGYAKNFTHRTGHSIGQEVHGNGANMDGLETRDDRKLVPHTCFSVEPGVYFPDCGVRTEINMYIGDGEAVVTGAIQEEIIPILG